MTKYASCWWLHDHLELGPAGEVHSCCYQYANSKNEIRGSVELCRITGNTFPASDIAAARARVHAEIANNTHLDCCECPTLKTTSWRERKYLTRGLTMNVWSHCNLKCRYCFTTAPGFKYSKVNYPLVEVIGDMLAGRHIDPNGSVGWGGGDISALAEFNELSLMFLDYGLKQDFKTSAYKYLRGVSATLEKRKGTVEVSVDAGTRQTYADYKGADVFDRVVENIYKYRDHGEIKLKYIACGRNLSDADIDGFVDIAKRSRPTHVTVTPEYGESWSKQYDAPTIKQLAKLVRSLSDAGVKTLPDNPIDGKRIFPDFWPALQAELNLKHTLRSGAKAAARYLLPN